MIFIKEILCKLNLKNDNTQLMNSANPNSNVIDSFQPRELNCPICYQSYDSFYKRQTIICTNMHTICAQCVGSLESLTCPFCRIRIDFNQAPAREYASPRISSEVPVPAEQAIMNPSSELIAHAQRQSINRNIYPPPVSCLTRLMDFIKSINWKSFLLQIILMAILTNVPLLIFNMIFAISDSDPICVDTRYNFLLTTRQYFLIIQIWGLVNGIFFIIVQINERILEIGRYSRIWRLITYIEALSILVMIACWVVFEPILFFLVVRQHCSGGIYTYCLTQVIIILAMPIISLVIQKMRT